jgi:hypothetical protein
MNHPGKLCKLISFKKNQPEVNIRDRCAFTIGLSSNNVKIMFYVDKLSQNIVNKYKI